MAFDSLQESIENSFKKITGKDKINQNDIMEINRDLKKALIDADVNLDVIKSFLENIKEKALKQKIIKGLDAKKQIIKIVRDELTLLLGEKTKEIDFSKKQNIMLVGLQGSGKTTTIAKLANYIQTNFNKKILIIAADVYRPAAIDQLITLGDSINVDVYYEKDNKNVISIIQSGYDKASKEKFDIILIDTAGRTSVDEQMLSEIKSIKDNFIIDKTLFVQDAMQGQESANIIKTFDSYTKLDGAILTKLDSDTRGGSALSIKSISDINILFSGTGEKITNFEIFHPKRMAQRILGMGDVLSLIEKAEKELDEKETQKLNQAIASGKFTYNDFLISMQQMNKLGGITSILKMIPGMSKISKLANMVDETKINGVKSIILSMTNEEKDNPKLLKSFSRKNRIAKGSGKDITEVNKLIKNFDSMRQIMEKSKGDPSKMLSSMKMPPGININDMFKDLDLGGENLDLNNEEIKPDYSQINQQRKLYNKKKKKKKR